MRLTSRLIVFLASVLLSVSVALSCVVEVLGHLRLEAVRGVVYESHKDLPVEGAFVEVWETKAKTYDQYFKTGSSASAKRIAVKVTDKEGKFALEELRPGKYEIRFISKRYGAREAFLEVHSAKQPDRQKPQEAVIFLSRGDGPCGGVSQRDKK
jgi:uncharacterized protein (DUF2141 family)